MIPTTNTKIIATIGPASWDMHTIHALIKAGSTIFRLNCSHATHPELKRTISNIRKAEKETNTTVTIIQDLQGPKIRLNRFTSPIKVCVGETIKLALCKDVDDNPGEICITCPGLDKEIEVGQRIFIDDGKIELKVKNISRNKIETEVKKGGSIEPRKGVNLPDTVLSLTSLTEQDLRDVEFGVENGADYVALSFVRSKKDVLELRNLLQKLGSSIRIISKIEKPEALKDLKNIMECSDAVLIARGDLGVEIEPERVPVIQKEILSLAKITKTPAIVATQMLETMTKNPTPTRAEVTDVFQAVRDGADAVMLSGETANGDYPIETVKMMKRIIKESEKNIDERRMAVELSEDTDKAIASISGAITDKINAKFICCFTSSGWTAKLISKTSIKHPILAFIETTDIARKINLYRGVTAINMDTKLKSLDSMFDILNDKLKQDKLAERGTKVVVVAGSPFGIPGNTNLIKVHTVD